MVGLSRKIHLCSPTDASFTLHGWSIRQYQEDSLLEYLEKFDHELKTEYVKGFEKAKNKIEYFKYVIVHEEGGIFVRYSSVNEIEFNQIEEIVNYFHRREITLFACPSMLVSCLNHHPQLLSILTNEEGFIPFSSIYTTAGENEGYKTLVTSLTLPKYLKKIAEDKISSSAQNSRPNIRVTYNIDNIGFGIVTFCAGLLLGWSVNKSG